MDRGADDSFVSFLSNDGFARADPLSPPTDLGSTGYVDRFGPADQGGLIELDLGNIGLFAPAEFTLYFGLTYGVPDALSAVSNVGADVYLLAEPNPARMSRQRS